MSSFESYPSVASQVDDFFTDARLQAILENEALQGCMRIVSVFPLEQKPEVVDMLGEAGFGASELELEENYRDQTLEVNFSARDFVRKDPTTNLQLLKQRFLCSEPDVGTDENVVNSAGEELNTFSPPENTTDCTLQALTLRLKRDNPDWYAGMLNGMGYLATNS